MRFLGLVVLLLLAKPSEAASFPPKLAKSEYLLTSSVGVVIERGIVFFYLKYEAARELPDGYVLGFLFENPADDKNPITEVGRLEIDGKEILVESPLMTCIRNNRNYEVMVEIFSNFTKSERLGTHKQQIQFRVGDYTLEALEIPSC